MNTQLVKTLAQIINSLSPEEKQLLETELQPKTDWDIIKQSILERGKAIDQRLNNRSLQDAITDVISDMRGGSKEPETYYDQGVLVVKSELSETLSEWTSEADEEAYNDL